jgi:hypothetical protein
VPIGEAELSPSVFCIAFTIGCAAPQNGHS